jgi:hypothetical protein
MSDTVKRLLLVGFSLLLSLVLCEVALRVTGKPESAIAGWKAEGHPPSDLNQFGFRGNKLDPQPDEFVVALVGDSFVECVSSPIDFIPERLLEDELNKQGLPARVISLGARGYGQDQQLLAVQDFFEASRADMVVVWVIPDNDVWNNMFRTHYGGRPPKPTFRLEGGQLVPPSWEWMKRTEPAGLGWAVRRYLSPPDYDGEWEHHLPEPYKALDASPIPNPDRSWQKRWDENPGFQLEEYDQDRHHDVLHLEPRSKRLDYGVKLTVRLLQEIQSLCRQNKADFAVLFTGIWEGEVYDRPVDDLTWHELNGRFYGYSSVRYWANLRELYESFPLFVVPCTVDDWQVSETDLHFNKAANRQLMSDLAKKIIEQKNQGERKEE